jgi:hypothetical protein
MIKVYKVSKAIFGSEGDSKINTDAKNLVQSCTLLANLTMHYSHAKRDICYGHLAGTMGQLHATPDSDHIHYVNVVLIFYHQVILAHEWTVNMYCSALKVNTHTVYQNIVVGKSVTIFTPQITSQ